MSKKLRREPINIAPDIVGWLDDSYKPTVLDNRNNSELDPRNIDDKIIIYERQVTEWFLVPARNFVQYRNKNKGFIVLMICLSYLEGVEQLKQGISSRNRSRDFFVASLNRIYPRQYIRQDLEDFYKEARCGLFHNGMVQGRILIGNRHPEALKFVRNDILVNPKKLLTDIEIDFVNYIQSLKTDRILRLNFDCMYSNV